MSRPGATRNWVRFARKKPNALDVTPLMSNASGLFPLASFCAFLRSLGSSRVLSGRSGVNPVPLRAVKVAPAHHIWLFRKPCAIVKSDRMICLCQTPLAPRAALPLRRRAGLLLTPNCQKPSALSRHTEFTTELPESCERLWNLASSAIRRRYVDMSQIIGIDSLFVAKRTDTSNPLAHSFRAGSAGALEARKPRSLDCAAGTWGAWRRA